MDLTYPYPTYLEEMEAENAEASDLKAENERLLEEIKKIRRETDTKNQVIEEMRLEIRRHEAQKIKKIQDTHLRVDPACRFEGLVITAPLEYRATNGANKEIKTFNWVYSSRLGLIRSLNKRGIVKMEMRHVQAIRASRPERTRNFRSGKVGEDGELTLHVSFEFEPVILSSTREIVLDDQYLNGIFLPRNMRNEILRVIGTPNNERIKIGIKTEVKVRGDFLDIFNWNENAPIFEIKKILSVRVGNNVYQLN